MTKKHCLRSHDCRMPMDCYHIMDGWRPAFVGQGRHSGKPHTEEAKDELVEPITPLSFGDAVRETVNSEGFALVSREATANPWVAAIAAM